MKRKQISDEIINFSPANQRAELLQFLAICENESQWRAFTVCQWINKGLLSYQGNRKWTFNNNKLHNLLASQNSMTEL